MQTMTRPTIALDLTREQAALIVEGLAELPFRQVFELIGQLRTGAWGDDASARFPVTAVQLLLILQTLGGMPPARVRGLLDCMRRQLPVGKRGRRDE